MSKKEKVFSIFAKVGLVLTTIFMIVSIFNIATSLLALIPYIGTLITIAKAPIVSATSSIFVPGLVCTILGFFGDKAVAKKALTRLIVGVVISFIAIILMIVAGALIVGFGVVVGLISAILSEVASSAYLLMF